MKPCPQLQDPVHDASSQRFTLGRQSILFAAFFSFANINAESVLPDAERTNGAGTLSAVTSVEQAAKAHTVSLGASRDKPTIGGVIVSADGYILAPASELRSLQNIRVFLPDGSEAKPHEAKRDETRNLLLIKVDAGNLTPIRWETSTKLQFADWLCSYAGQGNTMRLGVVSAKRRNIPNSGAVIGVMLKGHDETDKVIISRISEEGPAEKAGLLAKDELLSVNGNHLESTEALRRQLAKHQPGDVVKLRYLREGKESECDIRLESRSRVRMGADDFANHGTSLRTDNFPEVIQHDMPLNPDSMGTAVYDLQGRAVGLNIARVDRVTNYALPSEVFVKQLDEWIKADRKAGK